MNTATPKGPKRNTGLSWGLGATLVLGLAGNPLQGATTFFSFEDGTTQGWAVNAADWANGFSAVAAISGHATDGTKSLQIDFTGKSFKWGGLRADLADPTFLKAIQYGGKLILDLHVPDASAGISQLGFVIQQPDVAGDLNWQQVWYFLGGKTGDFTIELPFERKGTGAVNLHLGQNAAEGQPFTVYVDNIRVESNPPPTSDPTPINLASFEDGTTQGWKLNTADWAAGFSGLENIEANATDGSHSLRVSFTGREYRWGALNEAITDAAFADAIKYGGKLLLDMYIPPDSAGIQNIGFTIQQPDVSDALNWQQVWFAVGNQSGNFTISLPFSRTGTAPVNLHLGQNSAVGQEFTIYLDNLRVLPNPPPPQGVTITRTTPFYSFEDGTEEGFIINDQAWGLAFTTIENSTENATDGTHSLKVTFPAGNFKWGAYALNITRPEVLSAISRGGTILVDMTIPESVKDIQHFGVTIIQPGALDGKDWQQRWFPVGGATGRYTIDLPFTRENDAATGIILGRNNTGDTDATVFLDNFRVVTTELIGAQPGTVRATKSAGKVSVEFTGLLQVADEVAGPYRDVPDAASPMAIDPARPGQFYRAAMKPLVYLEDDFDGANKGWQAKALAGDSGASHWVLGTPAFPGEIDFAYSGSKAWTTGLEAGYGENTAIALTSPVIDLAGAPGVRLSFFSLLDVGGADGDGDKVEVFVRDASGGVLTGAEQPFWTKTRLGKAPWFFGKEIADLPAVANGKKVKLEFRVTSDGNATGQRGWFLDDVSVYAKP